MSFFPSYETILGFLGKTSDVNGGTKVAVSIDFIRHLISKALRSEPFDEQFYLAAYPDIREGVTTGLITDPREHFIQVGFFEGRSGTALEFDHKWYRRAYEDLWGYGEGDERSLRDHYLRQGKGEWRAPNEQAVGELERWTGVLGRKG